jgi:hypothetical protein
MTPVACHSMTASAVSRFPDNGALTEEAVQPAGGRLSELSSLLLQGESESFFEDEHRWSGESDPSSPAGA